MLSVLSSRHCAYHMSCRVTRRRNRRWLWALALCGCFPHIDDEQVPLLPALPDLPRTRTPYTRTTWLWLQSLHATARFTVTVRRRAHPPYATPHTHTTTPPTTSTCTHSLRCSRPASIRSLTLTLTLTLTLSLPCSRPASIRSR